MSKFRHPISRSWSSPAFGVGLRAADVVVIGGGIVGCAAAYNLSCRGYDVIMVEKGDIAGEQSGRNWGFVRQQGRDAAELPLALAANKMWPCLSDELGTDIEWRQGGNLALVKDRSDADRYRSWAENAREVGVASSIVSMEEIRTMLPGVNAEWVFGVFTATDGQADPVKTTTAFAEAAVARGAQIISGTVTDIIQSHGRVERVRTSTGDITTNTVVIAAGIWTHRLLSRVGLRLPQRVVRQTVLRTNLQPRLTDIGVWDPDFLSFRQAVDGAFVISLGGVSSVSLGLGSIRNATKFLPVYLSNRSKFRLEPRDLTVGALRDLRASREYRIPDSIRTDDVRTSLARMSSWFPHLPNLEVASAWTGVIDGTPDAVPVIESSEQLRGLIIASGFSGHGFALAPIVGVIVADLVSRGHSEFDLEPMKLGRFSRRSSTRGHKIL